MMAQDRPLGEGAMAAPLLLTRNAEAAFWLGRQVERAENLARSMEVLDSFGTDTAEASRWTTILEINADTARYVDLHGEVTDRGVKRFYMRDADNPNSLATLVRMARENARVLRPVVSTEMWAQLNELHTRMGEMARRDLGGTAFAQICTIVRDEIQRHTGIMDGTIYRDQAWHFYWLGRSLERIDQITRLVDIQHNLVTTRGGKTGAFAISQWQALLRSASAYHAYRRAFPSRMSAQNVAGFLLMNEGFPRSATFNVRAAEQHLNTLHAVYGLKGAQRAADLLDGLRTTLTETPIDDVLSRGLHDFTDWVQRQIGEVVSTLIDAYMQR